jgi:hypothetical protein
MRHEESMIQKDFVSHVRSKFPDMVFTCAPAVAKSARQGRENRLMGYQKGWPDLFFPIPRKGYYGLFIEFKTMKGVIEKEQRHILDYLNGIGFKSVVCRSTCEAIQILTDYLKV